MEALHVAKVTLVWNLLLSLVKLFAGLLAHSAAMVSDAIHSASDVASTIVVMVGIKISSRKADTDHPYGHERLECVAAILLAVMLAAVGCGIGYGAVRSLIGSSDAELAAPGVLALVAAAVSIVVKEAMYHYTAHTARRINSPALMADAWHHRSDALSSIGALVGIAGARLGLPLLDPIASLVICAFILKAAWEIFLDAVNKVIDKSCDPATIRGLRRTVRAVPGVIRIDTLRTRAFGARIYVDVEIAVNGDLPLRDAHQIAERVHDQLEADFPAVKHVMVHENPAQNT